MPVRLTMLMRKGIDIYFFICNMTMFWRSWILSFWPQPLSPLRGSDWGLWSKFTFDMFHIYYTSWHKFWHLDPSVGRGSLLAKYFLPCCCICDSSLIWYVTGPCSEQVEFWPIDPKGWVGGGLPAKYLLPFCCIGDILKFNVQYVYVLKKLYFDT